MKETKDTTKVVITGDHTLCEEVQWALMLDPGFSTAKKYLEEQYKKGQEALIKAYVVFTFEGSDHFYWCISIPFQTEAVVASLRNLSLRYQSLIIRVAIGRFGSSNYKKFEIRSPKQIL